MLIYEWRSEFLASMVVCSKRSWNCNCRVSANRGFHLCSLWCFMLQSYTLFSVAAQIRMWLTEIFDCVFGGMASHVIVLTIHTTHPCSAATNPVFFRHVEPCCKKNAPASDELPVSAMPTTPGSRPSAMRAMCAWPGGCAKHARVGGYCSEHKEAAEPLQHSDQRSRSACRAAAPLRRPASAATRRLPLLAPYPKPRGRPRLQPISQSVALRSEPSGSRDAAPRARGSVAANNNPESQPLRRRPTRRADRPATAQCKSMALEDYLDSDIPTLAFGSMTLRCSHCEALHFPAERNKTAGTLSLCCKNGKLAHLPPVPDAPEPLRTYLVSAAPEARAFRKQIRRYNAAMSFVSFGANLEVKTGTTGNNAPPVCIVHGAVYHHSYSLRDHAGNTPRYAQFYLYDSREATQLRQRSHVELDMEILAQLGNLLDMVANPYAQAYRRMGELTNNLDESDAWPLQVSLDFESLGPITCRNCIYIYIYYYIYIILYISLVYNTSFVGRHVFCTIRFHMQHKIQTRCRDAKSERAAVLCPFYLNMSLLKYFGLVFFISWFSIRTQRTGVALTPTNTDMYQSLAAPQAD